MNLPANHSDLESLLQRVHARVAAMSHAQLAALDSLLEQFGDVPGDLRSQPPAILPSTSEGFAPISRSRDWPRAPLHRLSEQGTYFVTCGTLHKEHHFRGSDRLDYVEGRLLALAREYGWYLEAWAVFSNHYHFVAHSESGSGSLRVFLKHLHGDAARFVNAADGTEKRQVWHNFWETQLTFERSYLARLNYVHQNPVHHGIVRVANQYRWCSAAWFERSARPAQVKTIYGIRIDRIRVPDEYEPAASG